MEIKLTKRITGLTLMTVSIGIVYLWFGLLKFFPNFSLAEDLVKNTIQELTFGLIPSNISIILLAIWETGIGVLLIFNVYKRFTIILALLHMAFTFTPLFSPPELLFKSFPFAFTLLGQYIAKNIIIVSVLVFVLIENRKTAHSKKIS
ncbi:MAG: doxx family protein [Flavobacteriaceae bacterium]|nr:doxx family protein [Flavobacteriaceae bacterium]